MAVETPLALTPLVKSNQIAKELNVKDVYFKLDNLFPSGSFKTRGLGNAISKALERNPKINHLISSSGGNAGLAATLEALKHDLKITVFVPTTTSSNTIDVLKSNGADVVVHGSVWDITHTVAVEKCQELGDCGFLVHPFEGQDTWDGHSSLVHEIFDAGVEPDFLICSVGGGGLLSGVLTGLIARNAKTVVVAVETEGAASFHAAFNAGSLVELEKISSIAKSLGAKQVAQGSLDLTTKYGREKVISVVVSDKQALDAVKRFVNEFRMLVEPACGASLSLIFDKKLLLRALGTSLSAKTTIAVEVCGGFQVSLDAIADWSKIVQ